MATHDLYLADPGAMTARPTAFFSLMESGAPEVAINNGIATVSIEGSLGEYGDVSYKALQRAFQDMEDDDEVSEVLLIVNSPGGAVNGLDETSQALQALAKKKRVRAYVPYMAASAAYWLASNCESITAGRTAFVGSIGVVVSLLDSSEAAEKAGYKMIVIRSGDKKALGMPGEPVSKELLETMQSTVDHLAGIFFETVKGNRPKVKEEVFDGRILNAGEALKAGLIDKIGTLDSVLSGNHAQSEMVAQSHHKEGMEMPGTEKQEPVAASIRDIEGFCGENVDPGFAMNCIKSGLTLEQVGTAYVKSLTTQCDSLKKTNAELQEKVSSLEARIEEYESAKPGAPMAGANEPLGNAGIDPSNMTATAQWNAQIDANVAVGMTRQEATRRLAATNPDLRKAMLAEHNAGK